MMTHNAIAAYQQNEVELSVYSARPVELVVMLYDGAIQSLVQANALIQRGDIQAKAQQIIRATNIISELSGVLDLEQGEVAQNLDGIYGYARKQLLSANLRNDQRKINEVVHLLKELRSAWQELAQRQNESDRSARVASHQAQGLLARAG
ncbi:MAG: flagellar export chaperone FliS [Betaproteobacteria bacterium]|nr:flagellar export chaperone FliS [Betaproteobacteria bacterium]NDD15122.1 flagellar export chaperone FliS [Betaproteobacteria bacterium]